MCVGVSYSTAECRIRRGLRPTDKNEAERDKKKEWKRERKKEIGPGRKKEGNENFDYLMKSNPFYVNYDRSRGTHGVMVKVLDCGIVVSELELQSHFYDYIRTSSLGISMNPLILPAMS